MEKFIPLKEVLQKLKNSGLSQTEIARKAKIKDSYVSDIIKGKKTGERKYWFIIDNIGIPHSQITISDEKEKGNFSLSNPPPEIPSNQKTIDYLLKRITDLENENAELKKKDPDWNGSERRRAEK